MYYAQRVSLCFLMVVLSACGGGGSGSPRTNLHDMGGGSSPEQNIRAAIEDLAASADSLLATDLKIALPHSLQQGGIRQLTIDTTCQGGDTCTASFRGQALLNLSLSDGVIDQAIQLSRAGEQQGVSVAEGRGRIRHPGIETDVTLLGGWLDHMYFGVQLERVTNGMVEGVSIAGLEAGYGFAVGDATGTNPVGNATWTGAVVGTDTRNPTTRVQGDARISYDLAASNVDVMFSNLPRWADMTWMDLTVTNGRFGSHSIDGQFYGPNHEEVGGIFERSNLLGAFGARQ